MKLAGIDLSFLLVTHMADFEVRFDSYGILKSGQGAELALGRLDIQVNDQPLRVEDA
jgi:hypothetical protein